MYIVYLLVCEDNTLYTGITNNLAKRFQAHVNGKGSKYTRAHKPLKIVYQEDISTKSEALKRELEIKSWSRIQKIEKLDLKIL